MAQFKPKKYRCVNCNAEQYTNKKCYQCSGKEFVKINEPEKQQVFLIQYSNETDEGKEIDNEVYKNINYAESYLLENGYEKRINWNGNPFYEKSNPTRYANILKLNIKE